MQGTTPPRLPDFESRMSPSPDRTYEPRPAPEEIFVTFQDGPETR